MDATTLPNKRQRQTPRKSSTNTAALSTAIKNIQQEMNPYIRVSGTPFGTAKSVYIKRTAVGEFTLASGFIDVLPGQLLNIIPDGAKILGLKAMNITGRSLRVRIPSATTLVLNTGGAANPNVAIERVAYAPLSRFPIVKVGIPDLMAVNVDTGSTSPSAVLFSLFGGATDRIVVRFQYQLAI